MFIGVPRLIVACVPAYNEEKTIAKVVLCAQRHVDMVVVCDDGSNDLTAEIARRMGATVIRHKENLGYGAAMQSLFKKARDLKADVMVTLDADGQHDASDLPAFIDAARKNPEALVAGYPKYDESVPKLRYYGRYLTHVWVWINTLSFSIRDSMCGFRMYPLAAIVQQFEEEKCGDRMDFDTEAIVRWSWRDGRILNIPTQVHYPIDGVSHFNMWHDNFLITLMHTRLFFGMLRRLPVLLWRKLNG